jgi:acetyl coenzyme A synthetase (ADP forming)-like protein
MKKTSKYKAFAITTKYWRPREDYLQEIVNSVQGKIADGDWVVISEKAISTALNNIVDENSARPSLNARFIAKYWMRITWGRFLGPLCRFQERLIRRLREYPLEMGSHHKQIALCHSGFFQALMFGSEGGIDGSNLPYSYVSLPLRNATEIARKIHTQLRLKLQKKVFIMIADTDKTYSFRNFHFTPRPKPIKGIHSFGGFVAYVTGRMCSFKRRATPIAAAGCEVATEEALEIAEMSNHCRGFGAGRTVWDMAEKFKVGLAEVSWEMLETVRHKPIVIVRSKKVKARMDPSVEQLGAYFNPSSVAVVGATKRINKAGHVIFKNFAENKRRGVFKGEIYAVNPNENSILEFQSYPSLTHIPGKLDLAVIVVPAKIVPEIMRDAATKKVKNVVIVSSGFGEIGNHELENQVAEIGKKAGIRILGPNCLGVFDTRTGVDMLFLPETKVLTTGDEVIATPRPIPGDIAIVTQSGAFGVAALDYLTGRQVGISKFVSFGNKCDVTETEMLHYLLYDKETKAILLYVEDIKSGREFLKVAKKVTKKKPIVALKSGRTEAGARAAASHTGAIAGSDRIYDAVFAQTGILRAKDMEEFFDAGKALAMQPPSTGINVGIITDAGGPGIMAVDECELKGLAVKRFSEKTIAKFEKLKETGKLPKFATNLNPVDITGSGTSEMFETATEILFQDPDVEGIILLGLHHTPALQEDFIDRVAKVACKYDKPIVACDIGETEMALHTRSRFDKLEIPAYSSPEDAARAMNALVRYGLYLNKNSLLEEYKQDFFKAKQKRWHVRALS